jgi:hypothetical protein
MMKQENFEKIIAEKRRIAMEVKKVDSSKSWKVTEYKIAAEIKANISAYLQDKKSFDHNETKYHVVRRKEDELLGKGFLYLKEGDGGFYYSCITPKNQEIHDEKLHMTNLTCIRVASLKDDEKGRILENVSNKKHILSKKEILDGLLENIYLFSVHQGPSSQMKFLCESYIHFRDLDPSKKAEIDALESLLTENKKTLIKKTRVGFFNKKVNLEIKKIYENMHHLIYSVLMKYLLQLEPMKRQPRNIKH